MATATITISDDGDQVKFKIDFGEGGTDDESFAHYLAVQLFKAGADLLREAKEDE